MLWLTILIFMLIHSNFAKDKEPEIFRMYIYGDCYFYHLPTREICMKYFVKFGAAIENDFYTVEDESGKIKYNVRLIQCENLFGQIVQLYIYMTPEDIKLCNQKPSLFKKFL